MAKNKNIIVPILFLICITFSSFQKPTVSEVYLSQVGVVEKPRGSNWGPDVAHYLKSVNTNSPAPWCAAFVHFCLDSAEIKNTVTAYSPTAQNKKNLVYYKARLIKPVESGDVFTIFFPTMGRIAHTGFVHRQINGSTVETVEGNSNDGGSRDGYGVFRRKRPIHTLYSISRWK